MDNPAADLHLLRILNTPPRGISSTTASVIIDKSRELRKSVWDTLLDERLAEDCSERSMAAIRSFTSLMRKYLAQFAAAREPHAAVLRRFLEEIGYGEYIMRTCKTEEERLQREAAVDELLVTMNSLQPSPGKLTDLLAGICLDDSREEEDDLEGKSGVCLITMHAAKGLEFPVVYIVGVEQGLLPHSRSVDEGNLDEERRLLYVGITRAQEKLTLSYCSKRVRYGKEENCAPSEFIEEIPGNLYEFVDYDALMAEPATEEECMNFFDSMRELLND